MATLERKTWRGKDGKRQAAGNYTVHAFHDRRRYKVPGFSCDANGRRLSNELGRNIEKLLEARAGGTIPLGLRQYVETLPARIRTSLARQGVIDAAAEGKTLAEHVANYKAALAQKGNTAKHVAETSRMLLACFGACGCGMLRDVTTAKLRDYLAVRRAERPQTDSNGQIKLDADGKPVMRRGISARRFNALITAVGGFFRWCIRDRRTFENPAENVPKLNEKLDRRHERRDLTPAEVRRLLAAATAGGEAFGMAGPERALLYRTAVETGLRLNELSTLTRRYVDLDACTITVRAGYSKRRREDVQPIRPELAEALRQHLERKTPAARVFGMPDCHKMLRAFKADLAAAGITSTDDTERVVDFHALRHTFLSSLAMGGVHPKTAQSLARHSTITLTMDRYTHTLRGAEAAALSALPDYEAREAAAVKKTGTDNVPASPDAAAPAPQSARGRARGR